MCENFGERGGGETHSPYSHVSRLWCLITLLNVHHGHCSSAPCRGAPLFRRQQNTPGCREKDISLNSTDTYPAVFAVCVCHLKHLDCTVSISRSSSCAFWGDTSRHPSPLNNFITTPLVGREDCYPERRDADDADDVCKYLCKSVSCCHPNNGSWECAFLFVSFGDSRAKGAP